MSSEVIDVLDFDHHIEHHVPLSEHSTMGVGGSTRYFVRAKNALYVQSAYQWAATKALPIAVIGSGSNVVWTDAGFKGLILRIDIEAFRVDETSEEEVFVRLGAGEVLDSVVERTVRMGFWGIERLSHIPGTCGGAVFQNSGAYGQEISQILVDVEVYDTQARSNVVLSNQACKFSYRSSTFKLDENGRYVVLGLTIRLQRHNMNREVDFPLPGLAPAHTLKEVRTAVITIRMSKLPDTAVFPNCGSFFVNPTLQQDVFNSKPDLVNAPHHCVGAHHVKIPAAWLIEQCGLKGHVDLDLGFGTWRNQPLCIVVIAEQSASCRNLMKYARYIATCVNEKFGILLEPEPIFLGD
ncbi:UDP-N-acetylenolpyruvoylglucosamine reductase [Polychaeton citri CBS 116435]|uniref:UDP-N-acetylmuramate dehydrogenase n=1 Tax=Polychaeton citri CBS 116435 TaxID=1314669 RepID=A0A9P4QIS8_9PEZI|nr:UDP-N-acetylenolpyruvoylglucosamine reductase [Polychaeton citri CBS 116435]